MHFAPSTRVPGLPFCSWYSCSHGKHSAGVEGGFSSYLGLISSIHEAEWWVEGNSCLATGLTYLRKIVRSTKMREHKWA